MAVLKRSLQNKQRLKRRFAKYLLVEDIKQYMDGSKSDKGMGARVCGPETGSFAAMGINPTIFQPEIHTIWKCSEAAIIELILLEITWKLQPSNIKIDR